MTGAIIVHRLLSASAARAQNGDDDAQGATDRAPAPHPAANDVIGTVISIDEDDIVIDLGSAKGASDGGIVELWRPFKLRHPVTGRTLTDRFRIGSLRLVQVQKTLSWARPEGVLARAPSAGDVVLMPRPAAPGEPRTAPRTRSAERPVPPAPTAAPAPAHEAEPLDAEGRELCAIFDSLKGQPILRRIARYEQYLQAHPNGAYARVLSEEAGALRQLLTSASAGTAPANTAERSVTFAPPSSALAHQPLAIGIEIPAMAGAVLHVRHAGEVAYRSLPMRPSGPRYYRATIERAQMEAPEVEYFIEAVNDSGMAAPAAGSADSPIRIEVHDGPRPSPISRPAASAAIFTDYADYNRLRGNDYAWQTEGQFGLRYNDTGVRAVRSGFGVYRGVGGSVYELDSLGLNPRRVGLTYGYLEGEFGTSKVVGLIGRLAVGLNDDGVNAGGQFFLRLGNDRLTNLLLGGEVLGGIGTRGIAELQWNTLPRIPIVFRTEVTNQPAGASVRGSTDPSSPVATDRGDVGARAMVQIGYRFVPELAVAVRASYEGRTIQHAGPGAGAGVTYSW